MSNIDQVLEKYIDKSKADHAIMITGAWGCGKTHYWNHSIVPLITEKGLKPIYLSLYGVSSTADLESNLFWHMALSSIDPKKHKWVRGGAMVAKGMLGVVSNIAAGGGKVDLDPSALFKDIDLKASVLGEMQKYVVCFDDLERSNIPISELLGFINHYVEHQGMKTVIIAHESEVGNLASKPAENSDNDGVTKEFDRVKEKVIGRIVTYKPDIAVVCPQLMLSYKDTDHAFTGFIQGHSDRFIRMLIKFKVDNFRSIRFILDNLREQYNAIEKKELIDNAFQKLLLFNVIIALEYKKGFLTSKDVNDPHSLNDLYQLNRMMSFKKAQANVYDEPQKEEEISSELKYIKRIVNEYLTDENEPTIDLILDYVYLPSVYHFILTGVLNTDELDKDLSALLPENVPPHIAAFRRLLVNNFRELEEAEFRSLTRMVWDYAKKGTYVIYDYSQIASFFKYFIKNGLVNASEADLENMVQKGIAISIKKGNTSIENTHRMETMFHFATGDEFVDKVVKPWIQNAHQGIKSKVVANDAIQFLSLVESADQEGLAIFMKSRPVTPFFQQITEKRLRKSLKGCSHQSLMLLNAHIQERYKSNYPDYLVAEHNTVQVMLDYFRNEAGRLKKMSVRKFNMNELIQSLKVAIDSLDKASPKTI